MLKNFIIPLAYLYIAATFAVFFLPLDVLIELTKEDHYFENVGAVSCFLAAIFFFLAWLRDKKGNDFGRIRFRKNIFFLLMAGTMFFIGGEYALYS